jgi:Kef-type K+ transport system membrane component KefB
LGAKAAVSGHAGDFALWSGVLTAPIVFALDLTIGYALANTRCGKPSTATWLHLLTAVSLAAVGAGAFIAARAPRENERAEFMARFAMMSAALFAIVIVAIGIARFVLHVCY